MLTLPDAILALLVPFAPLFEVRTWRKAQILLVGAILTPGRRTVAAALRVMGLDGDRSYARYHHVLSRASWSSLAASQVLLTLLIRHLDRGSGPLVFGIDETIERRWGPRISARGIYRDTVRSSRSCHVKTSGLRWISMMWLGHVPWAGRHWALPFLTVLAPSERFHTRRGRRHKKLTDWARQMIVLLRRWLPHRPIVVVGDGAYAVLHLLGVCQSLPQPVTMIHPAAPRCRPVCSRTTPQARPDRQAQGQGAAPAHTQATPRYDLHTVDPHRGGLVRRPYTHPSDRLRHRRLVSLRQAPGAHPPRPDPRPQGRTRPPGPAEHGPNRGARADSRMVRAARSDRTWGSRHSANGPTAPSPAPRQRCWASSPGSPWPPTRCNETSR